MTGGGAGAGCPFFGALSFAFVFDDDDDIFIDASLDVNLLVLDFPEAEA
jgi:hypothetical protein